MLSRFQAIKAQMPRRESARRNHPLACESDIIETLHMRLTLLQMSFGKHIERKHCCFFPGEVSTRVRKVRIVRIAGFEYSKIDSAYIVKLFYIFLFICFSTFPTFLFFALHVINLKLQK